MRLSIKKALLAGLVLAAAAVLVYTDWVRIVPYAVLKRLAPPAGLNLAAYRATLQAYPIDGLSKNASGLTYSSTTNSLFLVVNRPAAVAEVSLDGQLLRKMPLPGIADAEGISHIEEDLFLVSDESNNTLHWIRIPPHSSETEPVKIEPMSLGFQAVHNLGLEGVSWDERRAELFLVNEKLPQRVVVVAGMEAPSQKTVQPAPLNDAKKNAPASEPSLRVTSWHPDLWFGPLGRDLASVTVVPETGHVLLLSEASGLLSEYTRSGQLKGLLPLWRGVAGLHQTIPQPEGLTLGPDGSVFIISEPNLLYRFSKQP